MESQQRRLPSRTPEVSVRGAKGAIVLLVVSCGSGQLVCDDEVGRGSGDGPLDRRDGVLGGDHSAIGAFATDRDGQRADRGLWQHRFERRKELDTVRGGQQRFLGDRQVVYKRRSEAKLHRAPGHCGVFAHKTDKVE